MKLPKGEASKTHWRALEDPRFLGVWSLPGGEPMTVTIESVKREMISFRGQPEEGRSVAYLAGQKPLVLNATHQKAISTLYGNFIEDWAGRDITLQQSMANLDGEQVECLGIMPVVVPKPKFPITAARLAKAIAQIKAGKYTADQVRAGFALTDAQEAKLAAA